MANEARLNLVISARDEAKATIEAFANSLKSTFEGLQSQMTQAFSAGTATEGVTKAFQNITDATFMTRTQLEEMFNSVRNSFGNIGLAATDASQLTTSQLRNIIEEANGMRIQVVQDMEDSSNAMQHLDQSMSFMNLQMAGEMIQQLGEQITGFFEDAVSSAADFDQSIVNTTASLNANLGTVKLNTGQIQAMQDAAIKMGESGFYSANQVAEAMNTMSRNGLTYQQIMAGGIDTVYKVAAANQSDIEQTANVVSDIYNEMGGIFKETGMNAQQAAQLIGNSMTVAMHHARISMDDFMNTMKYIGPQASAMGVGIKDVASLISLLGQHAIRGTQAGTTLRTMMTNLTPVSKEAAVQMKALGMITKDGSNIFFDAHGKMKAMTEVQQILHDKLGALTPQMQEMAIKTIFGRYALSGMTAIVDTAPSKFQSLTAAMNNNNTMTDIMKEKSTGLGMEIQKMNAHWETVKKTIGESLKPVVESLISGLNGMMKMWEGMSPGVKQAIIVFSAISGVLLVVGGGFLALIGTIGMFATSFSAGLAAFSTIGTILMGPVGIIIAAVALIGIAAYELYKHWDQVKAGLSSAWNAISNTAKSVWNGISSFFKQWGITLLAIFVPVLGLPLLIAQHWNQIKTFASDIFNATINGIKNIWNGAINWIKGVAQGFVNIIVDAFKWMYNHNYYFQDLVDFIKKAWDTIVKDAKTIWNGFTKILSDVWNAVKNAAEAFWNREKSGFLNIWNSIVNGAKTVWNGLTSFFSGLWRGISSATSSAWNGIKSTISSLVNAAVNALKGPFNNLGSFFSGLWGQAKQWGANLINMMADGIKGAASKVGNAVKSVASSIASFLGFHSPTKEGPGSDADAWMPNMMNMFVQGVQQHAPQLQMAIGNVALGLKSGVTNMGNTVHQNHISMPATRGAGRPATNIYIQIDGRSAKTDNDIAENVAKKIYQQMHVIS